MAAEHRWAAPLRNTLSQRGSEVSRRYNVPRVIATFVLCALVPGGDDAKPLRQRAAQVERASEPKKEAAKSERAKWERAKRERAKRERAKRERAKRERAKWERAKWERDSARDYPRQLAVAVGRAFAPARLEPRGTTRMTRLHRRR